MGKKTISRRKRFTLLQDLLHTYGNWDYSFGEGINRLMEQNGEYRNQLTNIPHWFLTKVQMQCNTCKMQKMPFSINGACEIRSLWTNKMHTDLNLTHYTKINWKRIMDLNVKCTTIKHLEKETEYSGCRDRQSS